MRILSGLWARIAARIAASPALARLQDEDDPVRSRRTRAAVVGLCLLLHLGFLILLRSPGSSVPRPPPERRMEITFIERLAPVVDSPPSMPRRPARLAARSLRAVRIDPPRPRASTRDAMLDAAAADDAPPSAGDLLRQIPAFADGLDDDSRLGIRDPLRPLKPRLPGSEVAIVHGIKLRREITPQDVVKAVGVLFGGGYEPCPDLLGKMHDATITNPASYSDAERRDLMESERRCRHR